MITSLPYSFVRFDMPVLACCDGVSDTCLPVINPDDLFFQVQSDTDLSGSQLSVTKLDGTIVSNQTGFVSAGNNIYSWMGNIDITGLACDECFQLFIGESSSNCFIKCCDTCFTSLLNFSNSTDYAGFAYCNTAFYNRVRLPFFLTKPKMNDVRTIYVKSNGGIKLTSSVLTKEYSGQTDYMPEWMHDAFSVALAHASIDVVSDNYTGGISKSGDYNPGWEEGNCLAQADFKVGVSPLVIRNNNCQECVPIACPVISDIVGDVSSDDTVEPGTWSFDWTNATSGSEGRFVIIKIDGTDLFNDAYAGPSPITDTSTLLPATGSTVTLRVPTDSVVSATLNGDAGTISGTGTGITATWTGVTGNIIIEFTTV